MRRSRFEKHQKRNKEVLEKWVNLKLEPRKRKVENLETGFRDGVNLCFLFEQLSKKKLPKFFRKPKNDIQKTENLRIVLKPINEFIQGVGIQLVFTPSSIMKDKKLRIISLLLILFKKFEIPSFHDEDEEEEEEVEGEESTKKSSQASSRKIDSENVKTKVDRLKQFTQTVLEPYREQYNISVIDFDSSWKNGIAFNCLLHAINPNLVNLDDINPNDPRGNIENALNIATEKLGIPQLIEVDDIAEHPNPTVIMMFLAMLYQHYLNELKKRKKRELEEASMKKKKEEEEDSDSSDVSSDSEEEEDSDDEEKKKKEDEPQQHAQPQHRHHEEIMMKNPEVPESLDTLRTDITILKQHLMMVKQQVEHQNWVIRNLKEENELAGLRSDVLMRMILQCHPNSFPLEWLSEGMKNTGFRMGFPLLQCELEHKEKWNWNITSPFQMPITMTEPKGPQFKKSNPYECSLSESRHFIVEGLRKYDWSSHFKISFRASPYPMKGKGRGVFVLDVAGSWRVELSLVKTLVGSLVELRMDVTLKTVDLGRVKAKLRKRWKPKSTRDQLSEKDILNYCVYFNGRKLTIWAEGPKYVIGEKEVVTLKKFTSVRTSDSPLRILGYSKLQKKDLEELKKEEEGGGGGGGKKGKTKKKKKSKKRKKKNESGEDEEDDEDYLKTDKFGKMGVKIGQDKRFTHPTYIEIISMN